MEGKIENLRREMAYGNDGWFQYLIKFKTAFGLSKDFLKNFSGKKKEWLMISSNAAKLSGKILTGLARGWRIDEDKKELAVMVELLRRQNVELAVFYSDYCVHSQSINQLYIKTYKLLMQDDLIAGLINKIRELESENDELKTVLHCIYKCPFVEYDPIEQKLEFIFRELNAYENLTYDDILKDFKNGHRDTKEAGRREGENPYEIF